MGPIVIFDKSTLESLNPDEAMWLDQFYLCNITPLFFVETLADLEKSVRGGRTPEDVVGSLAYRTPDCSSKSNAHHMRLLEGELLSGATLDLELGRPHVAGGRTVELEGKQGIIFEPSPEEEAFSRWQRGEFLDLERQRAKQWRLALSNLDLDSHYRSFQSFFPLGKPRTLHDVKRFVDFYLDGPDQEAVLAFGLALVGVSTQEQGAVLQRWRSEGKPNIRVFAPYFTHIFSADLFFYLAIAADIIGRSRPSHKIDLAYIYYLPFCMVFTSNDKLHADITPFFLRSNQTFVPGSDLKADLARLDAHYSALPDEEKQRGVMRFARYPPKDDGFLTTRLSDKHMAPTWRERELHLNRDQEGEIAGHLSEQIRRMKEAPAVAQESEVATDEADYVAFRRLVSGRKGKWDRFPPEVMRNREK